MLRNNFRIVCIAAVIGLALAACGPANKQHQGYFSYGFETVSFRPCNLNEAWWVTGEGDAMRELTERYEAVAGFDYAEVYVELRGETSPRGEYGHLGGYTREFTVTEVLEVGGDPAPDC